MDVNDKNAKLDDSMEVYNGDNDDEQMEIGSLGLQSLESKTFDLGDREAEKDDGCKNVMYTNVMAANLNNPFYKICLNKKLTDYRIPIC